ncbi:hypothetical protein, partial [Brevibacterium paucivorans]|uniref:hypothetical protein n=1 Tax=Brevibacterium paucivorans TaxID=170994 RepID=UPI001CA4BA9C
RVFLLPTGAPLPSHHPTPFSRILRLSNSFYGDIFRLTGVFLRLTGGFRLTGVFAANRSPAAEPPPHTL